MWQALNAFQAVCLAHERWIIADAVRVTNMFPSLLLISVQDTMPLLSDSNQAAL